MLNELFKSAPGKILACLVVAVIVIMLIRLMFRENLEILPDASNTLFGVLVRSPERPFNRTY